MRMMIVGAHPADAIDLAGGTIINHFMQGNEIFVLSVTDGVRSHNNIANMGIVEKGRELCNAVSILIDADVLVAIKSVDFMGMADEPFIYGADDEIALINRIRKTKPDILITHHPNEYAHWDHAEVGKMVCRALKGAIKLSGNKWWVPNVYFFATQFRPETARLGYMPRPPDVLIDIKEVVGKKVKAMCCFKSQGLGNEHAMWNRMNSMESEMGRADGLEYAEGFISYYPLKENLLPVSSINKSFYGKEREDE